MIKPLNVLHREGVSAPSVRTGHQDGLRHQRHLLHGLWAARHAGDPVSRIQGETLTGGLPGGFAGRSGFCVTAGFV